MRALNSRVARRPFVFYALVLMLASSVAAAAGAGQKLGLFDKAQEAFLAPDEAFVFSAEVRGTNTVVVHWRIAEGYYLYRARFAFRSPAGTGVSLGVPVFPKGVSKEDEYLGQTEVYYGDLAVILPIHRINIAERHLRLEVSYQGCAEAGLCYSPIKKVVELTLPAV
ncbi:MAG: hypothetical protein LBV36_00260 [Chromatiales bacterium]|jgi:thiol:disulfide interchange protein DsbD|nr:hypothetical protein [Chromatiales bacterium]